MTLDEYKRLLLHGAADGVQAWLELVLSQAIPEAPIEFGTLRGSGYAEHEINDELLEVVGQVGFPRVYAAVQHERLDFEHPRGGKPKYLEDPFKANLPRYEEAIAAGIKRRQIEAGLVR